MKHARLVIILTIALLAGFAVFFVLSLFTVKDVICEYSVYGAADFEDVENILSDYEGRNVFLVNTEEITARINGETIFNVEGVEKEYPSTIRVKLSSRQERFAVETVGGYYILDEVFAVSEIRADKKNSADELDNILLTFTGMQAPELVLKKRADYENDPALKLIKGVIDGIESPRDHIISIDVEKKEENNFYVTVSFREGVVAEIRTANDLTAEKAEKTFERYFALSDWDKLSGKILCFNREGVGVVAQYEP